MTYAVDVDNMDTTEKICYIIKNQIIDNFVGVFSQVDSNLGSIDRRIDVRSALQQLSREAEENHYEVSWGKTSGEDGDVFILSLVCEHEECELRVMQASFDADI